MHVDLSLDEIAAKITLAPWRGNARLRGKLHDDIEQYWSLLRRTIERAVEEELEKP